MIVTSDAIVLRRRKFRETSVIGTLYTEKFGKISVIAKGARDRRNKFGSALQPMNHVTAVFYKKESQELHLISQCDLVETFRRLSDNLGNMEAALSIVELVDLVSHSEEENRPLFSLIVQVLQALNAATKNYSLALYYFEMKMLDLLGFRPDLVICAECGKRLDGENLTTDKNELRLNSSGLVCQACSSRGLGLEPLRPGSVRVLQRLQELSSVEAAMRITLTPSTRNEVSAALRKYLEIHVEILRRRKSDAVFSAIS